MAFSFWKDSAARPDAAADVWFTPGRFALLLCLLAGATFPGLLTGGSLVYKDFGYVTVPFASHVRESFWRGEVPLWNPLNLCGLPFLGQWGTQPLYPPALLYVFLPLVWAVNFFCLAHLVWGGVGMYRLLEHWTHDRFAASLGGVAFAFGAVFLSCLTWVHSAAALGWMPWVVLALERCWTGGRRELAVAAMMGALQMLSGAPEIIAQTWLIIGGLAAAHWLRSGLAKAANAHAIPLCLVAVMLAVAALAAVQLLPFLDLLRHSQRTAAYGGSAWAMPGWGWANFLVPLFYAEASPAGVYAQHGQYWISSYYIGAGVLALAVLAVCKIRQPPVWLFGGMVVLSLVMALGEGSPLYGWVRNVVPLGFMRYPVKFVISAAFLVPVLAALAVTQFSFASAHHPRRRMVGAIGAVLVVGMGGIVWYARQAPLAGTSWEVVWQSGLSRAVLLAAVLALVAALPRMIAPGRRSAAKVGILVLVWLDLATHSPNLQPVVNAGVFAPGLMEQYLQPLPKLGESRAMLSAEANYQFYGMMISDPGRDFLSHRAGLYSNCNLLDNVPKVDAFNSLYPREIWETLAPAYIATNGYPARLADFMGVVQVTAPGELFKWQARTSHAPIITAGQQPVFAAAETTLRDIYRPEFDGRHTVYLPLEAMGRLKAVSAPGTTVSVKEFRAHRVEAEVVAPTAAMVVVAQSYYHWWRATVNGTAVPLWRANHGFQALEVPAGRSLVTLTYEDRSFRTGAVVSAIGWLACFVGWLSGRRRAHHHPA
jgi:hypothetical protein